jgi:hypothetical protein
MKTIRCFLLMVTALVAASPLLNAADAVSDGPVSLVILYRAKPEKRIEFRSWLKNDGAARFAKWKKEGVFANHQVLFSTFGATSTFDAAIILDFAHYTDSARWKEVEKNFPGGLTDEALKLAAPESTSYSDALAHGVSANRDLSKSVYLMTFYEVVTDSPKYKKYAEGYVVPQMKGWLAEGALSGYSLYLNHNPLGKPWDAMLLLEYSDIAGVARRDDVKAKVRVQLAASDPVWLEWSKDKSAIRHEVTIVMADALAPAKP